VILNSHPHDYIAMSDRVSRALKELKEFNLQRIYLNSRIKRYTEIIRMLFEMLFEKYMRDLENENYDSPIFKRFLEDKSDEYKANHLPAEIVRDFIAGMTDRYFLHQFPEDMRPKTIIA
jgi:dGTPase